MDEELSQVIRGVVELDAALVYNPSCLATAVCFNKAIKGDFFTVVGRTFTICDPTYIGGDAMLFVNNIDVTVRVIK